MPRSKRAARRSAPSFLPAAVKKPEPSELSIHIAVASHLRFRARPGLVWWHTPNGEKREKRDAAKLKAMGTLAGLPDFFFLDNGRLFGLELKRNKGRISPEQRAVSAALERNGATCATAFGLDDALAVLEGWGLILPDRGRVVAPDLFTPRLRAA